MDTFLRRTETLPAEADDPWVACEGARRPRELAWVLASCPGPWVPLPMGRRLQRPSSPVACAELPGHARNPARHRSEQAPRRSVRPRAERVCLQVSCAGSGPRTPAPGSPTALRAGPWGRRSPVPSFGDEQGRQENRGRCRHGSGAWRCPLPADSKGVAAREPAERPCCRRSRRWTPTLSGQRGSPACPSWSAPLCPGQGTVALTPTAPELEGPGENVSHKTSDLRLSQGPPDTRSPGTHG